MVCELDAAFCFNDVNEDYTHWFTLSHPLTKPAFLARQAMTVDHISNGRLDLGLGTGAPGCIDISHAVTGSPDWPPKEREDRFR